MPSKLEIDVDDGFAFVPAGFDTLDLIKSSTGVCLNVDGDVIGGDFASVENRESSLLTPAQLRRDLNGARQPAAGDGGAGQQGPSGDARDKEALSTPPATANLEPTPPAAVELESEQVWLQGLQNYISPGELTILFRCYVLFDHFIHHFHVTFI